MKHIIDYIRRPDTIDDDAIVQLQALTQEHPYFHVARILLLQALYKRHASTYDETLRRTAILIPNREANTLVCSTARASIIPCAYSSLSVALMPW